MKVLFYIIVFYCVSCSSIGPNFNTSRTHNGDVQQREKIILREGRRSQAKLNKTKKRARRDILRKTNKNKHGRKRRII